METLSNSIFSITLVSVVGGILLGASLRQRLPEHHLREDSRDAIKLATGLIATLVALVLGLLVGSAKSTFDATNSNIRQDGAQIITLDRTLAHYGPETSGIRAMLRDTVTNAVQRIWPANHAAGDVQGEIEMANGIDDVVVKIRELKPGNETQRLAQSQLLQIGNDLLQSDWLLIEQSVNSVPPAFLVILIFWLIILFMNFSLLAPRNLTTTVTLVVSAISISTAVFLILELGNPFDGTVKVSGAPLQRAIAVIGK